MDGRSVVEDAVRIIGSAENGGDDGDIGEGQQVVVDRERHG